MTCVRPLPTLSCSEWRKACQEQSGWLQGPCQASSISSPRPRPVPASEQTCRSRHLLTPGRGQHDRRDRDISQSTHPDLKSLISPRAAKLSYVRFQPLCSQAGLAGQNCLPHDALKETTSQHQFPTRSNGQGGLCPVCGILGPDLWCQDTCH